MFLADKLRDQLPRQLQQIGILVMPTPFSWEPEPVLVIFMANGRSVEFEVDLETGLTDMQIAHLCVAF
jgi:hypothetical protein